jgi:hypothetical protein
MLERVEATGRRHDVQSRHLVPFEREPRKCRVKITRRDRVKLTFSDTKLDEFVTDAEIATVDEAIQKAKHLLDTALVN